MSSKRPFRVIIVGGGVAGLTLVGMLEKFDIDYILLEAHAEIYPAKGAAIGLMPNGNFILDQIGYYDAVKAAAMEGDLDNSRMRGRNGKIISSLTHCPYHHEKRHGYPWLFFDRQKFLQVLYSQVKNKDRIHVKKRVDVIEPLEGSVRVTTTGGHSYSGDIVLGADGIHSKVRSEMRRIANTVDPSLFEPKEEDEVPCYYQCHFGAAQDVEGWPSSDQSFTTGTGVSCLVVSGPKGRCYWFVFVRLPEAKYGKDIPRYSKEDAEEFVKKYENLQITETLTFHQVHAKRVDGSSTLTAIHEVVFKKWFFGRMLLVGDSAHKPNPIGGMGGNGAIETSAEFLNALLDMKARRGNTLDGLTTEETNQIFKCVQDARFKRAVDTITQSHQLQDIVSYEKPWLSAVALNVLAPLAGKHNYFREFSSRVVKGSRLKHLPLPSRPRALPYDHELPAKPLGAIIDKFTRALFFFAVALLVYYAHHTMTPSHGGLGLHSLKSWDDGWLSLLKESIRPLSRPVFDSGADSTLSLLYLLVNALSPVLIYTVEGHRIGRYGSLLYFPLIFFIGMVFQGPGRSALLYALISVLHSPQTTIDRPVPVEIAKALLPALVLGFMLPAILLARSEIRIPALPLLVPILTAGFGAVARSWRRKYGDEDADKHSEWYSSDDVPFLKRAYGLVFGSQIAAQAGMLAQTALTRNLSIMDLLQDMTRPLYDLVASGKIPVDLSDELMWLRVGAVGHSLYSILELRRQGYVTTSKAFEAALVALVGHIVVGPGASWLGVYRWRENVILGLSSSSSR